MSNVYESYVDVDEKWVKKIPAHWQMKRLKAILAMRKEKNNPVVTENILSLTAKQGVVPYAEKEGTGGNKPKSDMTQYNIAHENDLLVNCMNVVSGAAGVSRYFGAISPVYYALYPHNDENVWYYHHIFRLMPFQRSLVGLGKGILMHESDEGTLTSVRMRISMDYLGNVLLPIPPRDEQDQIVRFLDWKVSEINKLINIKKKEIKEITELKKTLIHDAVTHGLNHNVPMKHSGIEWLGDIPYDWEIKRAKYMYKKENRPINQDDDVVTCFRDGTVTLRKNRRTTGFTESIQEFGYQGIKKGDLVIHVMDAFAGAIGVSDSDDKGTPVYSVCTAIGDYNNYYYAFILREMAKKGFIKSLYKGIRERSSDFRYDVFANQFLPVPPRSEQDKIVRFLDSKVSNINEMINIKKNQIDELEELKNRLISDVVTGQIDVRDVEIPDFEFEDESLDTSEENTEDELIEEED